MKGDIPLSLVEVAMLPAVTVSYESARSLAKAPGNTIGFIYRLSPLVFYYVSNRSCGLCNNVSLNIKHANSFLLRYLKKQARVCIINACSFLSYDS